MFQTASLFSIEVDYYNFGTCEMTGIHIAINHLHATPTLRDNVRPPKFILSDEIHNAEASIFEKPSEAFPSSAYMLCSCLVSYILR